MRNNINKHIIRFLKDNGYLPYFKKKIRQACQNVSFKNIDCLGIVDYSLYNTFMDYMIAKNNKDVQTLFDEFLKSNNLYEQYYKNLDRKFIRKYSYITGDWRKTSTFDLLKMHNQPYDYINRAFSWEDTKEGHNTWLRLSTKWRNITNKLYAVLLKKDSFDEPLFKTTKAYIDFANKYSKN